LAIDFLWPQLARADGPVVQIESSFLFQEAGSSAGGRLLAGYCVGKANTPFAFSLCGESNLGWYADATEDDSPEIVIGGGLRLGPQFFITRNLSFLAGFVGAYLPDVGEDHTSTESLAPGFFMGANLLLPVGKKSSAGLEVGWEILRPFYLVDKGGMNDHPNWVDIVGVGLRISP